MHDNTGTSGGGYLGDRFRSCPSCGELIPTGISRCRFCDAAVGPTERPDAETQSPPPPTPEPTPYYSQHRTAPPVSDVDESADRDHLKRATAVHYTKDGKRIPPEYPSKFNPYAFCAPAFFFPDLWHAEKGLIGKARLHFFLKLADTVTLAGLLIVATWFGTQVANPFDMDKNIAAVIGLIAIIWFFAWVADLGFAFSSATIAHREYTNLFNSVSQSRMDLLRRNGLVTYWTMLYAPFLVFLVGFSIMLIQISDKVK